MELPLPRDHWQRQIASMDPQTQWAEIYGIVTGHEFPWESQHASEIALVHTFAVPEIAELLARTGEFTERAEKRFDDQTSATVTPPRATVKWPDSSEKFGPCPRRKPSKVSV